jgi:hypothetical protein
VHAIELGLQHRDTLIDRVSIGLGFLRLLLEGIDLPAQQLGRFLAVALLELADAILETGADDFIASIRLASSSSACFQIVNFANWASTNALSAAHLSAARLAAKACRNALKASLRCLASSVSSASNRSRAARVLAMSV